MEDPSGNVRPNLSGLRQPALPRRSGRWTVLFVGENGRIVPVKRFKGLVYLLALLLLLAFGAAGGLYLVNRHSLAENRRLSSELQRLQQEVSSLRHDRDMLTTRLVMAEAELNELRPPVKATLPKTAAPSPPEGHGESDTAKSPADEAEEATPGPNAPETAPETAREADREPDVAALESVASVGQKADTEETAPVNPVNVADLAVAREPERNLFRVTFLIRKDAPGDDSISGYAFVVLKPEEASTAKDWVTMPPASIEAGRPTPPRRGQYFSIARFKPMKFETIGPASPDRFEQLTVFVFSPSGELLLQQDYPIPQDGADGG